MANAVRIAITGSSTDGAERDQGREQGCQGGVRGRPVQAQGRLDLARPACHPHSRQSGPTGGHMGAGAVAAAAFGAALSPRDGR